MRIARRKAERMTLTPLISAGLDLRPGSFAAWLSPEPRVTPGKQVVFFPGQLVAHPSGRCQNACFFGEIVAEFCVLPQVSSEGGFMQRTRYPRASANHASFSSDTSDRTLLAAGRRNHRPEGFHLYRGRQRGPAAYGYAFDPWTERADHQSDDFRVGGVFRNFFAGEAGTAIRGNRICESQHRLLAHRISQVRNASGRSFFADGRAGAAGVSAG